MEDNTTEICPNCEKSHEKGFSFCPHCGQQAEDDLTIGVLFYNTISNYFSFDARFLKSFFPLLFRPGYLAREFVKGKRLLYLHPAQMYLFISVVFFFIISFSTRDLVSKADELNEKVVKSNALDIENNVNDINLDSLVSHSGMKSLKINDSIPVSNSVSNTISNLKNLDSITRNEIKDNDAEISWDFNRSLIDSMIATGAKDEEIYKAMGMSSDPGYFEKRLFKSVLSLYKGRGAGSIVQAFFDSIPIAMFVLLPIFAFMLKILYFNKGKYAFHLVFSFYFFSYLFTVFAILFSVNRFLIDIPDWIDWLIAFSTYFYFLIALHVFYKQNYILTFIKSGIVSFIFLLMIIPLAASIVAAFSFLYY
jgi:hypothetical protein